jgi:uncharacterized protein (TIGR02646 family)
MIRIAKPEDAPAVLLEKGKPETEAMCHAFALAQSEYLAGTQKFDFDPAIYAAEDVKNALREAQHHKCAFCESSISHIAYGDVEHYRPKKGYLQDEEDELHRPGYYWLAYEWDNLFYCCQLCNQRFKRNLFPLRNNKQRARSHTAKLEKEKPLLLHPCRNNPSDFIEFKDEYARPVKKCREGVATIELMGLNRKELVEKRRERLGWLRTLQEAAQALRLQVAESTSPELVAVLNNVESRLTASQTDAAEYAAMARAFLASDA